MNQPRMLHIFLILKVLNEIFARNLDTDFRKNASNIVEQHRSALQDDSLLSALLHPWVLRTCLDLVQENIFTHNIKIVEVGACRGNLFPKFVTLLNSRPLTQVIYIYSIYIF